MYNRTSGLESTGAVRHSLLVVYDSLFGHATKHVRGLILKDSFEQAGWNINFVDYRASTPEDLYQLAVAVDAVYLLKVADVQFVYKLVRETCAKIVFDLTDALWMPVFKKNGWQHLNAILRTCHAVFCDNKYTYAYGRKYNKNVFSIPACTNVEKFEAFRESLNLPVERKCNAAQIVIGWIGSASTVSALNSIQWTLQRLLTRHPECHLRIVGSDDLSLLAAFGEGRVSLRGSYDEDAMIEELSCFDIGIFPAPNTSEDFAIRGPLKALLYMSARKPVVTLNAGICAELIKDGETGMLVNSAKDWERKLESLIVSEPLRQRMGRAGFDLVRERHSVSGVFAVTEQAFLDVLALPVDNFGWRGRVAGLKKILGTRW